MTTEKWSPEAPNGNVRGMVNGRNGQILFANLDLPYEERERIAHLAARAPALLDVTQRQAEEIASLIAEREALLRERVTPTMREALATLHPLRVEHRELHAALAGMLSIHDSVTQGQERELREKWIPKVRALLARVVTP